MVEQHQFSADVNKVLQIVVESLYKNDEVFLRELISNASDALEKRRYLSLQDEKKKADEKLGIEVKFDDQYIEVIDNGIGMNHDDLIAQLGQIAHSGTGEIIKKMQEAKSKNELIGQFGVGFYSAFVVADEVIVKSRKVGEKDGWLWSTKTDENLYSIDKLDGLPEGTSVRIKLKDDKKEFASFHRLQTIVDKYSSHISFPITMYEPSNDEDKKEEPTPTVVNRAKAIWTVPKKELTKADYDSYYSDLNHMDAEPPVIYGDFRVEGKVSYNSIVFIPSKAPFDLWHAEYKHGLKLYVQRVFIQEDQDALLPMYLRFVKGVVDTQDLSLNVSREMLQNNPVLNQIKTSLTKKTLGMLQDLIKNEPKTYDQIWTEFGSVLKTGLGEDFSNRDQIMSLLRFKSNLRDGLISLKDYVEKADKKQKKIYYLTTDRFEAGLTSPYIEIFNKKNIEVLILDDRVDEWMVSNLRNFEEMTLQSIAHGGLEDFSDKKDDEKAEGKKSTENKIHQKFFDQIKKSLENQIKDVQESTRLTQSPCCLISDTQEMSSHLKRMLKDAGQEIPESKPILELNMEHPLIVRAMDAKDQQFEKYIELIHGQALLMDGEQLKDPTQFVKTMNELMTVDVNTTQ